MNSPALPRAGAACGAIFAIVLFAANGDGNQGFNAVRAVAGIAALTLAIPFFATVCTRLRDAGAHTGWLSTTALMAGIVGISLKLGSGAPELALHRAHIPKGTQLYNTIEAIGDSATLLSLYPLALFWAVTALLALRAHALPRWLGVGAALPA